MGSDVDCIEVSGDGTVYSFTTIHSAPAGFDPPYGIALVDLEHGRLMVRFHGQDMSIGMRVTVDDQGEITVGARWC
jgi:uncharacterized OB-fold protein